MLNTHMQKHMFSSKNIANMQHYSIFGGPFAHMAMSWVAEQESLNKTSQMLYTENKRVWRPTINLPGTISGKFQQKHKLTNKN